MRLVAVPDGVIDRRDRAVWMTIPFDSAWNALTPLTEAGIEFTLPINRPDFTLPMNKADYELPINRLDYTLPSRG